MNGIELIEKFQCPGCVCGSDTQCGKYKPMDREDGSASCETHVLGTMIGLGNNIALGLPRGFCKPGPRLENRDDKWHMSARNQMEIRLWSAGTNPGWDDLNVPVWALEQEGFLFVRTFAPRVNLSWVDVIEGGTLAMVPKAINVAEFYDQID
jgi:hypothetical protein